VFIVKERILSLALFSVALLGGCATATVPVVVGTVNDPVIRELAAAGETVFLLPPHVTFESADNEQPLSGESCGGDKAEVATAMYVAEGLAGEGFAVLTLDDMPAESEPKARDLVDKLDAECSVLTSSYKDKSLLIPLLNELCGISGAGVVCVQTVKIKVGSGETYDINSGAMTQGTSSSTIKVALVSPDNGKVLWKNESFVRYLPTSGKFKQAVQLLFSAPRGK